MSRGEQKESQGMEEEPELPSLAETSHHHRHQNFGKQRKASSLPFLYLMSTNEYVEPGEFCDLFASLLVLIKIYYLYEVSMLIMISFLSLYDGFGWVDASFGFACGFLFHHSDAPCCD